MRHRLRSSPAICQCVPLFQGLVGVQQGYLHQEEPELFHLKNLQQMSFGRMGFVLGTLLLHVFRVAAFVCK